MDWNKLATLLDVVHKAASAGPAYAWILDQANAALIAIKDEATPKVLSEEDLAKVSPSFSGLKIPGDPPPVKDQTNG